MLADANMKTKAFVVAALLATSFNALLFPSESVACGASCFPGAFLPADADVPASIPGILWVASRGYITPVSPSDVGLFQITGMSETPVDVDVQTISDKLIYVFVPVAPLAPNADYVIRDSKVCEEGGPIAEATFHTTDAAPLPNKLGMIHVGPIVDGQVELPTRDGSCSVYVAGSSSQIALVLDPEAEPFANAFDYTTLVDGMPWRPSHSLIQRIMPGASWEGRGKDLLFVQCDPDAHPDDVEPLAEGDHTVVFRAKLPGSDVVLESASATVSLHCPSVEPPPPDDVTIDQCVMIPGAMTQRQPFFMMLSMASIFLASWARRKRCA